jgi:hypothetical protein
MGAVRCTNSRGFRVQMHSLSTIFRCLEMAMEQGFRVAGLLRSHLCGHRSEGVVLATAGTSLRDTEQQLMTYIQVPCGLPHITGRPAQALPLQDKGAVPQGSLRRGNGQGRTYLSSQRHNVSPGSTVDQLTFSSPHCSLTAGRSSSLSHQIAAEVLRRRGSLHDRPRQVMASAMTKFDCSST